MRFLEFVRSFNFPFVAKIDRWLNERVVPPSIIVGLDKMLCYTKAVDISPFQRRHCDTCGGERLFALWFDGGYHCLRDLFAIRQGIVNVGCMACRTTSTPHFVGPDGGGHCNVCWSRNAFEAVARCQNAIVAQPTMEAAMPIPVAPAANNVGTRQTQRKEDSFASPLPS